MNEIINIEITFKYKGKEYADAVSFYGNEKIDEQNLLDILKRCIRTIKDLKDKNENNNK